MSLLTYYLVSDNYRAILTRKRSGMDYAKGQTTERDQETRRSILKAAQKLFLAKGYKGVSMKDLAEQVHVTSAALYYHFPEGKLEIFTNMILMLSEEMHSSTVQVIAQVTSLEERLICLAEHQMTTVEQFNSSYSELQRDIERFCTDEHKRSILTQHGARFQYLISEIFQSGIDEGEISSAVPAPILATIFQGGYISLQLSRTFIQHDPDTFDTKAYARMLVNVLLNGMRQSKAR